MAETYSDEYLRSLLEGTKTKPDQATPAKSSPESEELSDEYLRSLLGNEEALQVPPDTFQKLGFGRQASNEQQPGVDGGRRLPEIPRMFQPGARVAVGAAAALGDLVAGVANLGGKVVAPPPTGEAYAPIKFDRTEFIRTFERVGLLGEANILDTLFQYGGEGVVNALSLTKGASALVKAGFTHRVANALALGGTTAAHMQTQAVNQGRSLPAPIDTAVGLGIMAFGIGGGHLASPYIRRGIERFAGTLTKQTAGIVDNATMATFFSLPTITGIPGVLPRDPKEGVLRGIADAAAFSISGMHQTLFSGETRARTTADAKANANIVEEAVNEFNILGRTPSKNPNLDFDLKIQERQAATKYRNAQVRPDGTKTPVSELPTASAIAREFGLPLETAERVIASSKLDYVGRSELIAERKNEAMLNQAEAEGGIAMRAAVAERLGLLTPEEKAVIDVLRKPLTDEQEAAVSDFVARAAKPLSRERPVVLGEPRIKEIGEFKQRQKPPKPPSFLAEHGKTHSESPPPLQPRIKEIGEFKQRKRAETIAAFEEATKPTATATATEKSGLQMGREFQEAKDRIQDERFFPQSRATPLPPKRTGGTAKPSRRVLASREVPESVAAKQGRVLDTAGEATQAEVRAAVEPPVETANRTRQAAKRALAAEKSEELHQSPPGAPESVATTRAREVLEQQQALLAAETEAAAKAIEARAARNGKLRPKLTGDDGNLTFFGKAAVTGVAAGTALASQAIDDDETASAVALAAGVPFLALMRGGKRSPSEKFGDRLVLADAAETAKLREAVERRIVPLAETFIYTGGKGPDRGPRAVERTVKDISDLLLAYKETAPDQSGAKAWLAKNDALIEPVGHILATKFDAPGRMLNRLLQDMHRRVGMRTQEMEYEHARLPTGRWKDKPHLNLHGEAADTLNRFMDHLANPGMPAPDLGLFSKHQNAARRAGIQMSVYHGYRPPSAADAIVVRDGHEFYRQQFAKVAAEAEMRNESFAPLHSVRGAEYRPAPLRDEMFDPPTLLKYVNRPEYYKRLERARELQKGRAEEIGMSVSEIRSILTYLKDHGYQADRMMDQPLDALNTQKSPNLDFHRFLRGTVGSEWDPAKQLNRYYPAAMRRLEFMSHFGVKGELAQVLLKAGAKLGHDVDVMKELFDLGSGMAPGLVNPRLVGRSLRDLSALATMPKLGTSAIPQLSQAFVGAMDLGVGPTINAWRKGIKASVAQSTIIPKAWRERLGDEDAARFLAKADVVTRAVWLQEVQGAHSPIQAMQNLYYKGRGIASFDRMSRNIGGVLGDESFIRVRRDLEMARRRGDKNGVRESEAILDEMFRDEPVFQRIAKSATIEEGAYEYLRRVAAESVGRRINLRTMPIDMPRLFSHPVGRTAYVIGTYPYRQAAEMFKRVAAFHQATPRGKLRMIYGAGFATVGTAAVYALRDFLLNRDALTAEENENLAWFYMKYIGSRAFTGTFAPLYIDAFDKVRGKYGYTPAQKVGKLFPGALWSTTFTGIEALYESEQRGNADPMLDWAINNAVANPERKLVKKIRDEVAPPDSRRKKKIPK